MLYVCTNRAKMNFMGGRHNYTNVLRLSLNFFYTCIVEVRRCEYIYEGTQWLHNLNIFFVYL